MDTPEKKPEALVLAEDIKGRFDVSLDILQTFQANGGSKSAAGREFALAITRLQEASMWLSFALDRLKGNQ